MKRTVALAVALGAALLVTMSSPAAKVALTLATHWGAGQKEIIDAYAAEYMSLHPDVEIVHVATAVTDVNEYLQKIQVMHAGGKPADIIHIYSPWSITLRDTGVLARVPADVLDDVIGNYVPAAVAGTTLEGQVWGIPTEIDNYALLYNNRILSEAGIGPPSSWDELLRSAKVLTKYDSDGTLQRAGFAFLSGWPEAVAHPFLSMLYAEGGRLVTADNSRSLLDSHAALATLQRQVQMFEEGATNRAASAWSFPTGGTAMLIMAPWWEQPLRTAMGDAFSDVAAVPLPPGREGQATLLYSWGFAVDATSPNQRVAWDFLLWLTREREGKRTSRMGEFLVGQGIIPSRWGDVRNHPDQLMDAYTHAFVQSLDFSYPEPVTHRSGDVKAVLMREISAAWNGTKSATNALTEAKRQIDAILAEYIKR